jgi:hypothetical protein
VFKGAGANPIVKQEMDNEEDAKPAPGGQQ